MYDEITVKNNINIDVLKLIESKHFSRVEILAIAAAPITRISDWPRGASSLFKAVKALCKKHPELYVLPYDKMLPILRQWAKGLSVDKRIELVKDIAIISKYDNTGLWTFTKWYEAYKSIMASGRYVEIDYDKSADWFIQREISQQATPDPEPEPVIRPEQREPNFWIVVCSATTIDDSLEAGNISDLEFSNLRDDKGRRTSVRMSDKDWILMQDWDTEEIVGAGIINLDENQHLSYIEWRFNDVINITFQMIGEEELRPYLITHIGRINAIKQALDIK